MENNQNLFRCPWSEVSPLMTTYHDTEWGVPLHDDLKLFEFLVLDAFQAGLSWLTILKKRENFRFAFDNFNPTKIACYDEVKFAELIHNSDIIRNKMKISATINNAKAFLKIQEEFGLFSKFLWKFVDNKPLVNKWTSLKELPAKSELSDTISKEMVKRGFKFIGTTICYAFLQSTGLINDHIMTCYRYKEIISDSEILTL